jgi:DNA primase
MGFSPDFLDDIRSRVPLAGVIARRVQLRKRGREYLGLCPFHAEKTPSFTVNEDKGFYHCFGCGAHGDVIEFVMRAEGFAFPEAVERLAAEAGVAVPVQTPEAREAAQERQSLYEVVEAACAWFEGRLKDAAGRRALAYLKERGLDEETIARFRLGFAPDSRGALKAALCREARGEEAGGAPAARFPEEALVTAGLLIAPEGGGASYDRFRGRVIFPITDRRGRVIAFGGRALGDASPKYLNSPDTPLFHKGRVLYGLSLARAAASQSGQIIVAEGYMDVIALHRADFADAVAPLGTALSEEHIRELWRLAPEPVLCFDGDEAGLRAAVRVFDRVLPILRPGASLRFLILPEGEDPDSFIRDRGAGAFREALDRAIALDEAIWRIECRGRRVDTPERRAFVDSRLQERVRQIADRTVQTYYRSRFNERLARALRGGPAKTGSGTKAGRRSGREPVPQDPGIAAKIRVEAQKILPKILLAVAVNHPKVLEEVAEELGTLRFSPPALDGLRQEILNFAANQALDTELLKSHLMDQGYSEVLLSLSRQDLYLHARFARPEAAMGEVRSGWTHAVGRYRLEVVRAQVQEAQKACGENVTPENAERLRRLKKHLLEIQATVAGMDEVTIP